MNKYDGLLILIAVLLSLLLYFVQADKVALEKAQVKYDGDVILEIDLSVDQSQLFEVTGDMGPVIIETDLGKIRVKEETSPYNLCSKKGWVDTASDIIVCLPNRIVIELFGESDVDTLIY